MYALAVGVEQGREDLRDVLAIPRERDLRALGLRIDLLQRVAADEVVVELHERAVAELPRVQVVVLDVVGDKAPGERVGGLIAVGAGSHSR